MTLTQTSRVSPLAVAKNRYEEASRVTDAYKVQLSVRTRRGYTLRGTHGELQAWADVAEAERQLESAVRAELVASQEVAWEEHRRNEKRAAGWLRGH